MTHPLPANFRLIHLDLAREAGHPVGSMRDGYSLVLPIADDGRIDEQAAHAHGEACRVSRIAGGEPELGGVIRRGPGGHWTFDYGLETETPLRLSEHHFQPGEYLSVRRGEDEHTYVVISLQPIPAGSRVMDATA